MAKMNPAIQFCCGCSVGFGTAVIAACHLAVLVLYCAFAAARVVFRVEGLQTGANLPMTTFGTAWGLVGIPLCLCALWGVAGRIETQVRLYLYYLFASVLIDIVIVVLAMAQVDDCGGWKGVGNAVVFSDSATGFICGSERIFSIVFFGLALIVMGYCLYTVWSYCEDIREAGGGGNMKDLLADKAGAHARLVQRQNDHYGSHHNDLINNCYPSSYYDSSKIEGIGSNTPIVLSHFPSASADVP